MSPFCGAELYFCEHQERVSFVGFLSYARIRTKEVSFAAFFILANNILQNLCTVIGKLVGRGVRIHFYVSLVV